jgi:hypothetical protein
LQQNPDVSRVRQLRLPANVISGRDSSRPRAA